MINDWGQFGLEGRHLVDLDAGDLDVSLDLETGDVAGVGTVGEGGEGLIVDVDLEVGGFVDDDEVEADSLLEGDLAFPLFVAPFVGLEGVADNVLLIETGVEVKGDVAVLAQQVDVETAGLLLGGTVDDQLLSIWESAGNAAFIWDWLKR